MAYQNPTYAGAVWTAAIRTVTVSPTPLVSHTSLISLWKLAEASGNAVDSHGSNTLTDSNTVGVATGKIGGARDFESGTSEYFYLADNASLSTGDIDFSFAGWVNAESLNVTRTVLSKTNTSTAGEYHLRYNQTLNRFEFGIQNTTTFVWVQANTFGAPSTGVWYFLVAWHNATTNEIGICVNGGTADTASTGATVPSDSAQDFCIGGTAGGVQFWDGLIDEISFWKRVLTSDERTALYNNGYGLAYPFYYRQNVTAEQYAKAVWEYVTRVLFTPISTSQFQAGESYLEIRETRQYQVSSLYVNEYVESDDETQTATVLVATIAVSSVASAASGTGTSTNTAGTTTVTITGIAPAASGSGTVTTTPGIITVAITVLTTTGIGAGTVTTTAGVCTVIVSAAQPSALGNGSYTVTTAACTVAITVIQPDASTPTPDAQTGTPGICVVTVSSISPDASGSGSTTIVTGFCTVATSAISPSGTGSGPFTLTPGICTVLCSASSPAASVSGAATVTTGVSTVTVLAISPIASGVGTATATAGIITVLVTVEGVLIIADAVIPPLIPYDTNIRYTLDTELVNIQFTLPVDLVNLGE